MGLQKTKGIAEHKVKLDEIENALGTEEIETRKSVLVFIGLGLNSERDITLRGIEEAKSSDLVFAEFYTSKMPELNLKNLEKIIGKEIIVLSRKEVEEEGVKILEKAKNKKVALLVAGDPLISTTHVYLRIEAKKLGIETKVVHNASIISAAPSISGLQNYKFGRSTSLVFPEKNFFPTTPYDVIKENKARGLHTLVFLDIKEDKLMTANEGMRLLLEIEKKRKENVFTEDTKIVVLARVGSDFLSMRFGRVKELLNQDFGEPPHTLIIPGELHFMEEEYLARFG